MHVRRRFTDGQAEVAAEKNLRKSAFICGYNLLQSHGQDAHATMSGEANGAVFKPRYLRCRRR